MSAFIQYYDAWHTNRNLDTRYRNYVADALRVLTENTAILSKGQYITTRFADMVTQKKQPPKPQKTSQEIANDLISRMHQS